MITLIVWMCLATAPTDCRVMLIARGFTSDEQCKEHGPMMYLGWKTFFPDLVLREETEPFCVINPDWYIFRFGKGT